MKIKTKAYAAGLIDGDGYLGITHAQSQRRYQVEIVVGTTCRPLAKWLVKHFGGTFIVRPPPKPDTQNVWYMWRVTGKQSQKKFLSAIQPHLVLKKEQAKNLLEFIEIEINPVKRKEIFLAVRDQNSKTGSVETDTPNPLSKAGRAYYAGFFDAEGCVTNMQTRPVVKVSNTNTTLLKALQKVYGGNLGLLNNPLQKCYNLSIVRQADVKRFILYSLPYLIVKHPKAKKALLMLS